MQLNSKQIKEFKNEYEKQVKLYWFMFKEENCLFRFRPQLPNHENTNIGSKFYCRCGKFT